MTKHSYTVTVDEAGEAGRRLVFPMHSHDDIMLLAEKAGADDPNNLRLLLGVKLLGGILLEDRDDPLYTNFRHHFAAFMQAIKARRKQDQPQTAP
ncbi:DUF3861 family protein [Desulfovibrio sulfodismutans]|uniref:DUF3861 family protein n=1 Tax=Desulfolutivibrio sulfodismutans TaxID=63561 RepID=A0A7K3NQG1_9BACT|nr:DUF3861 family protein [Desulfolutivibrio sulfodismutans]NDY58411.1 DUF3861 family protein [Desulfolutivibrio sulfodismutans]QLA13975.1 DUF3861 family protein [Desulfolutivibrio sulfodismutans DSM 3696]